MDNSKLGDVLKIVQETNAWFHELRDQESPTRKQNRKKREQKKRAEQRRKEELKAVQEREDRKKEEAAQEQEVIKELAQMDSERQAAGEAFENASIAEGYLQGKGFLTVTKELHKDAQMLETLMNFNGHDKFPAKANMVKYHDMTWAVAKHSVTNRLYVLGLLDPHFVVMGREFPQVIVDSSLSSRQSFLFADFSPLVWVFTSALLVRFALAVI